MSDIPTPSFGTWSPARKAAAVVFASSAYAGLACLTIYLAGVLFLALNKINPAQASFGSIAHYWQLYAKVPPLRRKLQLAIAVPSVGLLVLLPAYLIAAARPRRSLHGDARFATIAEVRRAGLLGAEQPCIVLGRYRGNYLSLPGELSALLCAPTRSGKGVGAVIPTLLTWSDSVVALDIKGENYRITAGYRAAQGQPVYVFSPFDEGARSHRWNPLAAVRDEPRYRVGDLSDIAQALYPSNGTGTASEAFFNDHARNFFLGIGLMVLEMPELPRTIGEMLRQSSGMGRPVKSHIELLLKTRAASKRPFTPMCQQALMLTLSTSENTLSSIVATFAAPLTIFTNPVVDAATSADDFNLADLRRRRMSIFVRISPNKLDNARPLLNLFFSQLVDQNTKQTRQQDASLRFQCLLVNDEFTSMGRVGKLVNAAAFLSGFDLRLLTVVQAMSQLDEVYGDKAARTFATNHGLQIVFAPREQRDAAEYSAMLGQFTVRSTSHGRSQSFSGHSHSSVSRNESDQRRDLLLPQEVKELGSESLVIFRENCKPILGEKIRHYSDTVFKSRLLPPPTVPVVDVVEHIAAVGRRWRLVQTPLASGGIDAPSDGDSDGRGRLPGAGLNAFGKAMKDTFGAQRNRRELDWDGADKTPKLDDERGLDRRADDDPHP